MSGKPPTLFGGSMIIAGTVIGAGMLANPTATSGVWYAGSLLVLVYTWFSMLVSGLMILEVNTHYPHGANLDTMAKDLLGRAWSTANGLSVAFVLYLLTYAYIFVGGNMSAQALGAVSGLEVPLAAGQLAFFALFAACVWWSARWVDRFSTVLVGGMVIAFFWAAGGLAVSVKLPVLLDSAAPPDTRYWIYLGTALPVCLASFGFHGNVSSLLKYFRGDAPKVAKALKTGTLIALAVYIVWQTVVQGNLPRNQFGPVIRAEDNAAALIDTLAQFVPQSSLNSIIAFFSYTAIASSFLGVTLGLFDYLADLLGFDNSRAGRTKTAAVTFLPPLVCCLLFPTGFVTAIGYVGLAAAVWAAIVPALMLAAARKKFGTAKNWHLAGGTWLVWWVLLFGAANILAQLLSRAGKLPVFLG